MGQKVIPTSLRLYKKKNWDSKWIVKKKEYSDLLHFDLIIKKYFENIFNYKDIKLFKINIVKISKNIHIYLYVNQYTKNFYTLSYDKLFLHLNSYYKENNIKIFVKNIKIKDFDNLKRTIGRIINFLNKKKNFY